MSIESTFKNRIDINLQSNKPLQSTIQSTYSEREHIPVSRNSLKTSSREHRRQDRSKSRTRTFSVSANKPVDTVTEITDSNKHDRRQNEVKPTVERHEHIPVERRYSTPQLHLSTFLPHAFRNPKHYHRANTKEETNATTIIPNNINAPVATSSNNFTDMMTMKADSSFTLKSPVSSTNSSRFFFSDDSERLQTSHHEDSISSMSFIFEENTSEPRSTELFMIESHTPICVAEIYREHFFPYFHINYYGEFDYEGPFVASLRYFNTKNTVTDICEARAIIRTQYRNCDVIDVVNATNENNVLQMLFSKVKLPLIRTYGTVGDPKANEKIYLFDKTNDERYNCKIGVIYQRVHQTDEYQIFSNDNPSDEIWDFLQMLAEHVRLKDFKKYRGDLDTKEDLHGEFSYYTVYENHEIMFNVAPLIPSTKANGQCIERKGLIGNAFVCIVFQEIGASFSPDFISGKVIQIYITVQPTKHNEQLYYKVGIWRRNDITSVIDPPGGIYINDKSFSSYFLALLLNSVNVAIESPSLRSRVYEQRQRLKYEELKKLSYFFKLGPIPDYNLDNDYVHTQTDIRPTARRESFASNTTVTTNGSANTNPGRTSPVSTKKKGLSRKILGVFSSRAGSIAGPSVPLHSTNNDGVPSIPQTPSIPDAIMSLARTSIPLSKESFKPTRSIKLTPAPILPSRTVIPQIPQGIAIQPPTPSAILSNPFIPDSFTENNLINTAALDITPRSRSNSSPEDIVHTNKSQPFPVSTIDEEDLSTSTSEEEEDDDDSDDESDEDDKSFNHPLRDY